MKIDDKIMSYELTGNIGKLSPGGTEKVEEEKLHPDKQVQEQKPPEEDAVVHLSQASKEAQAVEELLGSLPDVRDDVVASIRSKIETGTYEVKYEAVADKMVDAFLNDLV
jgi:negative regulator of flagellin synthesis FlgM